MDNGEFLYENKTAIQSLQELCYLRKYPQPLFLDRSQGNQILITTVVGGKIYGSSGEGNTIAQACENAARETLSIWLKDKFNPLLLKSTTVSQNGNTTATSTPTTPTTTTTTLKSNGSSTSDNSGSNTPQVTNGTNSANGSTTDSQWNAVSLLHVFASSLLYDPASKPEYEVNKVDDKFVCELIVNHNSKILKTSGEGKTKVFAKRVAALAMLQNFYPNLHTVEEISDAITAGIESKKGEKKSSKAPKQVATQQQKETAVIAQPNPIVIQPSLPPPQTTENNTKDELTDTVVQVVSNFEKYNITVPTGYSFRLATSQDVDSILSLIRELAIYEQSVECFSLTREVLLRDGWGVNRKYSNSIYRPDFYVYLVDFNDGGCHKTVGMALFYQVYSTWKGRSIHLEDLFVQEEHRAHGLGTLLMRLVGAVVHEMNMTRYGWVCLTWNEKPRQFYKSLGTTELNDWVSIRMEDKSIEKFVYYGRPTPSKNVTDTTTTVIATSSDVAVSWNDKFAQARKIGNECDKDLLDFQINNTTSNGATATTSTPSATPNVRGRSTELEEGEDEEDPARESGGFCQPTSLATFVANELKLTEEMSNNVSSHREKKRPLIECTVNTDEVSGVVENGSENAVEFKRCRSDSSS